MTVQRDEVFDCEVLWSDRVDYETTSVIVKLSRDDVEDDERIKAIIIETLNRFGRVIDLRSYDWRVDVDDDAPEDVA